MGGEQLFEVGRRTFDTPEFRGIECIEVEARSVINRVPGGRMPFDWTINPYRGCMHACVYCFARPTHSYLDMDAGKDFETKIVVKVNAPEVLRRELAAKRWKGEHIAMGTGTDPYQRLEGRYRLMRGIIEALIDHRNPFSILTKGTLITRDLDLLVQAAEHAPVSAAFSIGTLDEQVWRETEPGTPNPKARIEAVRALVDAGIPTGVLMRRFSLASRIVPSSCARWWRRRSTRELRTYLRSCCTCAPVSARSSSPGCRKRTQTWSNGMRSCIASPTVRKVIGIGCRAEWAP